VRQFKKPIIIFHERGHVIPHLKGTQLAVLRAFFASMLQQQEGAGGGGLVLRQQLVSKL